MFTIKHNVPDVYVRKSRDFQLMCNTYNVLQMATKFDIDSMLNLTDTRLCNDTVLKLLQTKLGFFTNYEIVGEDLRTLLKSFPYLLRKKGTLTGIKQCIQLFFKIIDKTRAIEVSVVNNSTNEGTDIDGNRLNYDITTQVYVVNINILSKKFDITLLTEMLKYIIPAGYGLKYYFYTPNEFDTAVFQKDTVNIVFVSSSENSSIRAYKLYDEDKGQYTENTTSDLINNINTTPISSNKEFSKSFDNGDKTKHNYSYNTLLDVEEDI